MDHVSPSELQPGMVVAQKIICPSTGKLLVNEGVKLTDTMIRLLQVRHIPFVAVNDRYTLLVDPAESLHKLLKRLAEDRVNAYSPSLPEGNLSDKNLEAGRRIRPIIHNLLENYAVLTLLLDIRIINHDDFYHHIINTGVLSLLVGALMDLDDEQLYYLGMAAFLHDIGLREMPFLIGAKTRSSLEELQYKEHPQYGYYILKEMGVTKEVAEVLLYHHERWNGSGFPFGKKEQDIPILSRILAVVEEFDTLFHMEKKMPHTALDYIHSISNILLDGQIVQILSDNISVYPLGSLVRLSTGEVGVVVNVRKNKGPRPIVRVHYNRVNRPLTTTKQIDLNENRKVFIAKILQ